MTKAKGKAAKAKGAPPVNTGKKQANPKVRATSFKPGVSGNPAGRPKGSRNRLCSDFISDLHAAWLSAENISEEAFAKLPRGQRALIFMADNRPVSFVTAVGNLVPREFDLGDKTTSQPFLDAAKLALAGHFNTRKVDKHEDDDI